MKRILFIVLVAINLVACESEKRLLSIDVTPNIEAYVGNHIELAVSHTPSNALVPAYYYRSSDPFVASVNEQGVITCYHAGTCTIKVATADTRFFTTSVINVMPNMEVFDEPVTDFNTTKAAVKLKEGAQSIVYETSTID